MAMTRRQRQRRLHAHTNTDGKAGGWATARREQNRTRAENLRASFWSAWRTLLLPLLRLLLRGCQRRAAASPAQRGHLALKVVAAEAPMQPQQQPGPATGASLASSAREQRASSGTANGKGHTGKRRG